MATRLIQPQDKLPKLDIKAFGILSDLKMNLNQQISNTLPRKDYVNAILEIWEAALYLLDHNHPELHQEVARKLVANSSYGRKYIVQTAQHISLSGQHSVCVETLILILAHPSLLNCPAVESCVQDMYACVAGEGGEHGIDFLSRACTSRLARLEKYSGTLSSEEYGLISSIARACHELVRRTPRIQARKSRPAFLDPLSNLIAKMDEKFPTTNLEGLHSSLDIVTRLVSSTSTHLKGAGTLETSGDGPCDDLPSFPTIVDKPGGRHDNDFADISEISIFPTVDEVKSQHAVYLPSTNFLDTHVLEDPLQRYIDSMFRLLRHDTIGPVIGVLRELLGSDDPMAGRLYNNDLGADVYKGCTVHALYLDKKQGPRAVLSFFEPPDISDWPIQCRIGWWIDSTRLEEGRLLCFVSSEAGCQNTLFFQVTQKRVKGTDHNGQKCFSDCLVSDGKSPRITAKLICPKRSSFSQLARLFSNKTSGVLVDFNGILPETFLPVFKNLQKIRLDNHLPFYKWLVPTSSEVSNIPPLYARHAGFTFPLGCIAKNHGTELSLDPNIGFQRTNLTELETHTGLDNGQCQGLVAALSREYALIQGPPGTGKSYLGVQLVRVLLAVREQAKLGPIVVCCHTNHALDQFLKHLDAAGVDGIVRIGNRSNTPELESRNLRRLKFEAPLTTIERRDLEILDQKEASRRKQTQETAKDLQRTCEGPQDPHLLNYIAKTRPDIHRQLATKRRASVTPQAGLAAWLGTQRPSAVASEKCELEQLSHNAEVDIHDLSSAERWALLDHWMEEFSQKKVDIAFESVMEAELHRKNVGKIFDTVEQRILSKAHIIGITTSTVARRIDLFKSVSPKVMICEEAAEVSEPDFISTLIPGLEHLIQIGDHKQLRPHINNHKLGVESDTEKKWQFDRSQFERRATGEPGFSLMPFAQLNVQRRMRPEISKLIKRLYPDLRDHSITMDHPDVAGMRHDLFWLDHDYPEDAQYEGRHAMSHRNR
ncbi:Ff.00g086690.m01.CDS01 [Fusarium sp. VM40]|nr:Ff.00g086690.m01.CDS01 [Fusarium sp. VM40]